MQAQIYNPATSSVVRDRPRYAVYTRRAWGGNWTLATYLECLNFTVCAAPNMPKATFRYRSGDILREDGGDFGVEGRMQGLLDLYVAVGVLGDGTNGHTYHWHGVFTNESLKMLGADADANDQTFTAFGLQHLLDRCAIASTVITNDGSTAVGVRTPVAFNADYARGLSDLGNRSAGRLRFDGSAVAYCFEERRSSGSGGEVWTVKDIVEYLLAFYSPRDMAFGLAGQVDALDAIKMPNVRVSGQKVYAVLNEVIDRKRGLGWTLTVDESGTSPAVTVFTTIDQPITLDGATVPANYNVIDLTVPGETVDHELELDTLAKFDRIVVAGERIVSCFTVSFKDQTLEKGWSDAAETAYKAGSTADDATTAKHDAERKTDKFESVYRTFVIPENWGWRAGNGENTGGTNVVNVGCSFDGSVSSGFAQTYRQWGHRLMRHLPLKRAGLSTTLQGAPEYRDPIVLIKAPAPSTSGGDDSDGGGDGASDSAGVWRFIDNPEVGDDLAGSVRILDRGFGVHVGCSPNHLLAKNHWTGSTPEPAASGKKPKYDYEDLIATVAVETDERLSVVVSLNDQHPLAGDPARTLLIEVKDAHYWYLVPNTITDLKNGQPYRPSASELRSDEGLDASLGNYVLRDDGPYLRQVAALAQAWYGKSRASMSLTVADVLIAPIGTYVRTVTDGGRTLEVNSPVTTVNVDLDRMTTHVTTNFGELDVTIGGTPPAKHRLK